MYEEFQNWINYLAPKSIKLDCWKIIITYSKNCLTVVAHCVSYLLEEADSSLLLRFLQGACSNTFLIFSHFKCYCAIIVLIFRFFQIIFSSFHNFYLSLLFCSIKLPLSCLHQSFFVPKPLIFFYLNINLKKYLV